ncbi:MAG TPA: glycoside hydrolase family 19 protein [Thermoleophilaceae bacterium]|jgi:predicted chitinase
MSVRLALARAGVPAGIVQAEAPRAEKAMVEHAITTQARARDFLAQVLHESAGLRYFEEIASGAAYEGRADLGNTHPGDGRRYKGRGPIQLTGRANYRWAGHLLGLPLEQNPALAAQHDVGWRIAALYWKSHGLNELADQGQFVTITRRINGGTNGLAARVHYRQLVGGVDCRPQPPDPLRFLTDTERRWCREYDRLKHEGRDEPRRRALRAAMTRARKGVHAAATREPNGWHRHHRLERYRELKRRSS